MAFLSKYGEARVIEIPIIKRGVVDFAVGADWSPAAGDVKIIKDGGAAANVTNLPTAIASGNGAVWSFSLTATEMQAARVVVTVADAATKAVEDQAFVIETYGNASAQHALDLDTALASQTVGTATAVTTVNGMAANVITAASINDGALTAAKFASGAFDAVWSVATRTLTAFDASFKSGYALSAAGVQAIWDALTSALTTVGSIGKLLVDNINATISSRASQTSLDTLDDYVDTEVAAIKTETDKIAAIKAKTDSLTFTVTNQVDANVQSVNDASLTGNGSAANPWGPA